MNSDLYFKNQLCEKSKGFYINYFLKFYIFSLKKRLSLFENFSFETTFI